MNDLLSTLLAPIGLFVAFPLLALLPAVLFLAYFFWRRPAAAALRHRGPVHFSLFVGILWLAYAFYESMMGRASGGFKGDIRIDLIVLGPALFLLTVAAISSCIAFEKALRRGQVAAEPAPRQRAQGRPFALGIALIFIAFVVLKLLVWRSLTGKLDLRGHLVGLLLAFGLALFLIQGYRWARWILLAWSVAGALFNLFSWSSLSAAQRQDILPFRTWYLIFFLFYLVMSIYVLFSKRLRDYFGPAWATT